MQHYDKFNILLTCGINFWYLLDTPSFPLCKIIKVQVYHVHSTTYKQLSLPSFPLTLRFCMYGNVNDKVRWKISSEYIFQTFGGIPIWHICLPSCNNIPNKPSFRSSRF